MFVVRPDRAVCLDVFFFASILLFSRSCLCPCPFPPVISCPLSSSLSQRSDVGRSSGQTRGVCPTCPLTPFPTTHHDRFTAQLSRYFFSFLAVRSCGSLSATWRSSRRWRRTRERSCCPSCRIPSGFVWSNAGKRYVGDVFVFWGGVPHMNGPKKESTMLVSVCLGIGHEVLRVEPPVPERYIPAAREGRHGGIFF